MASECGNLSDLSSKPDEDVIIAGIAQDGLWASVDGGQSWSQMGTGAGSDVITNRATSFVYDPAHPEVFWESGLYNGGGVYQTIDDGLTFKQLGKNLSNDEVVSVDLTDADGKTLLAGGHERVQTLWKSVDGGQTWSGIGTNLPPGSNFSSYPLVVDANTFLLGITGFGGGLSGILRSTDGGTTWTQVSTQGGRSVPLVTSGGTIYWPSDAAAGLMKSTDAGVTWTQVTAANVIQSVAPSELPDGRLVSLSSQYVVVSSDEGASWKPASPQLPYSDATGVIYSTFQKAFFVWHYSCDAPNVPADAIMRYDFDYLTE